MAYYIVFVEREDGKEPSEHEISTQPFRELKNALACIRNHYGYEAGPARSYLSEDRKGSRFLVSSAKTENGSCDVYLEHR